jgi:dihydrofolate reductase
LGRRISLIWCEDADGGIGKEGDMPWRIREEMKHFRATTLHKPCVMGKKTYDSLPKLLTSRINIVVTANPDRYVDEVMWLDDPHRVIREVNAGEIMIIGGRTMYQFFEPFADRLYRTKLKRGDIDYDCDTFMPPINYRDDYYCVGVDDRKDFTIEVYNRVGTT